ncbi:cysteine dioxygenase 1 [Biomphalaria pfeifferi]|uniref:Cysteine dioxygenase n=1 Tax=Biomphalaria pfeifferi TaxID=112525 RepID=A0AAD8FAW9_BIOPF|nr:cysteine dioxygenase 1 [Biomphalaria pfeifferi]
MSRACFKEVINLEDLLLKIKDESYADFCNLKGIKHLIENYHSKRSDWERYSYLDPKESYSSNLVIENPGRYSALILCWQPGKGGKIQAHEGSNCFFKILQGCLKEEQYHWPSFRGTPMELQQEQTYYVDDLNYMSDVKGLHRVTNNSEDQVAVSLHIHTPPFRHYSWFKEETGELNRSEVTFVSVGGKPKGHACTLVNQTFRDTPAPW